ncbi:MAG: glycoside hydrolase family 3 C-terminal domain-containing protein [Bacilli bacterium]|nr:glycoside hydrolase family 3 C-terminal domain-containing protein [Bacilli bacterium]
MNKKTFLPIAFATLLLTACQAGGQSMDRLAPQNAFIGDKSNLQQKELALNVQIAEEGFVLLKNKDNMLPFGNDVKNISVFGKTSINLAYNGGGSGGGGSGGTNLQTSLENAGFTLNPTLTSFYKDNNKSGKGPSVSTGNYSSTGYNQIGETPASSYTDDVKASFSQYNDAAIIVIARWGTEGADEKTCDARDFDADGFSERHYLELSKNEEAMFEMVKENFDNIVVIINSGNVFQCDKFAEDDQISAVLWIGTPGQDGTKAVGSILNGTVNPSGRTVDTWARDFTQDPTYQNFADNSQTNLQEINGEKCYLPNDTMLDENGVPIMSLGTDKNYNNKQSPRWEGDGSVFGITKFPGGTATGEEYKIVKGGLNGVKPASYVSYEEGIYVDYRYYETVYQDMLKSNKNAAEDWYNGANDTGTGVIFPFGYGLSYTTFSQKIVNMNYAEGSVLNETTKVLEVEVEVENTGDVAGKEVVQLYWKAPYFKNEIEKADHVLCAFGKTQILEPGEKETVKLNFYLQDVANYDYIDANKNGFKGYELDGGDYELLLAKDAHEIIESKKFQVQSNGIKYETDRYTGHKVENRFTDRGFYNSLPDENDIEFTHMSRANFEETFPTHPTIEDRKVKANSRVEEFLTHEFTLADIDVETTFEYVPEGAHKTKEDIEALGWEQQETKLSQSQRIQLSEMKNIPQDDPKWVEFLNQFTYAEMENFVANGNFSNPSMSEIGKSSTRDSDGPNVWHGILWAGEPIVAATFNYDLVWQRGDMIGLEGSSGSWGWLGCGCNTHRSPFGGRNFEYFAADPYLMGKMCAATVGAATEKGVYCYFKHYAVNDQEKGREGVSTFVSEQALREIYLKSFQMAFQEGKSVGVMSSYNRLGLMETAASYPLLTEVTREEWGFQGTVLSDMTHSGNGSVNFKCYENVNNRVLSGMNVNLDQRGFGSYIEADWDSEMGCPTFKYEGDYYPSYSWWYAVRKSVREQLWMCANCGQSEGLTAPNEGILADAKYDLRVGEAVNIEIGLDGLSGELSIDKKTPLPAGLTLNNGVISGTPEKDCMVDINVLLTDGSSVSGKIIRLEILPELGTPGAAEKNKKKGCFGEVGTTVAIIAVLGFALCGLVAIKSLRKKEER